MQFVYLLDAGLDCVNIDNDIYKYLFKVRRHTIGEKLSFRNLKDNFLYTYEVINISKKDALLKLFSKEEMIIEANKKLHIIWSVVDTKTIANTIMSSLMKRELITDKTRSKNSRTRM